MNDDMFSQHQLSTSRDECKKNAEKINQHGVAISQKEEDIKTLSQQLQEQETLIAKLEHESAVAREGGDKRELELEECILKMTDQDAELRNKLEEVEKERNEVVRGLETAQVESELLQIQMAELREQHAEVKVSY